MKKVILTISSILIITNLYSQEYESLFGSESTYWNMTIGNLWGTSSTEHHVLGDTIIDNMSYKVINGYDGFEDILGFVRQDSINQKAWYRNNQTTDEILFMDLGLEVGDSLYIQGVWNSLHKHYIVDSIYIKDERKYLQFDLEISIPHIQFNNKFALIEGVGSNMGFRYQDNDFINGLPTILLCAFKNQEMVFGQGECTFTSIENVKPKLELSLFPNPVLENLTIKFHERLINGEIYIISSVGQVKYSKIGNLDDEEVIDLSKQNDGIYFVYILDSDNGKYEHKKIIKVTNNR